MHPMRVRRAVALEIDTLAMVYDIAVRGHLSPSVAAAFDDFEVVVGEDTTTFHGEITDRAALHGVINRIEQFGLVLLDLHAAR